MAYRAFAKPDKNQAKIVEELRELGFQVDDVHSVRGLGYDIVVTGRIYGGDVIATLRVEVKSIGGRLTDAEKKYHSESLYRQTLIIAYCTDDVLDWYGRV